MDRIPAIRRAILVRKPPFVLVGWTFVAIAVPLALRWVIDGGRFGVPFVTVFPALLLAALTLGWRSATVTAIVAGALASYFFRPAAAEVFASSANWAIVPLYLCSCAILIVAGETVRRLVRRQAKASEREALLNAELQHRVKNMLVVIHSLAVMTARHSDPAHFVDALSGRLAALARANEVLSPDGAAVCHLPKLVESTVAPFSAGNIATEGPACDLPGQSCVPLTLALHELCTNAVKYGALSKADGRVLVDWSVDESDRLLLHWRECDGPPVCQPDRSGMGSLLLRPQKGLDDVTLDYHPDGLSCRMAIDGVRRVSSRPSSVSDGPAR